MNFNIRSGATRPAEWLFENSDGASFPSRDPPDTFAHADTAIAHSRDIAVAGSSVIHPGSVDPKRGFPLNPLVINDFPSNAEFFNDLQMLFPSMGGDFDTFLSEDVRLPS